MRERPRFKISPALFMAVLIATSLGCGTKEETPKAIPRKQVIMIVVDTLRQDHLGCYGYKEPTSPAIDKLAEDSVLFERAHATSPWTEASIATMVTGAYPRVLGITTKAVTLPDEHTMLAERFKDRGFETAAVISHDMISKKNGFAQGYDLFDESQSGKGHLYVSSEQITKRGIGFVEKNREKDFFLFLHYFDPHWEYMPHQVLNTFPEYRGKIRSKRYRNVKLIRKMHEAGKLDDEDLRYMRSLYDSEIRFTDTHIDTLLSRLKELGLYRDSLIILVADHGEEFGEREDKWIGHAVKVTEEMIRVPLIIKLPGNAMKKRVPDRVSLVDLAPTVLDLMGLEKLDGLHIAGKPWKLDDMSSRTRDLFAETRRYGSWQTVISGKWKYVLNYKTGSEQLFDLDDDPFTWKDIREEHPGVIKTMTKKLEGWEDYQRMAIKTLDLSAKENVLTAEEKEKLEALGYIVQ